VRPESVNSNSFVTLSFDRIIQSSAWTGLLVVFLSLSFELREGGSGKRDAGTLLWELRPSVQGEERRTTSETIRSDSVYLKVELRP